jgi:hypothetical protein
MPLTKDHPKYDEHVWAGLIDDPATYARVKAEKEAAALAKLTPPKPCRIRTCNFAVDPGTDLCPRHRSQAGQ